MYITPKCPSQWRKHCLTAAERVNSPLVDSKRFEIQMLPRDDFGSRERACGGLMRVCAAVIITHCTRVTPPRALPALIRKDVIDIGFYANVAFVNVQHDTICIVIQSVPFISALIQRRSPNNSCSHKASTKRTTLANGTWPPMCASAPLDSSVMGRKHEKQFSIKWNASCEQKVLCV